jgi:hypothetical protein
MSLFKRAAEKLRGRGVVPAAQALGGATATYTTVNGYNWRHLAASCAAGVIFALGASALVIVESGYWLGSASDRPIVEGVKLSGVDVESLSAADIRARLMYSPEGGRALVDAIRGVKKELVDDLVRWLLSIDSQHRREAVQTVLNLSSAIGADAGKLKLAKALLEIDEPTAASLGGSDDILQLLRLFAKITRDDRIALMAANIPVRPVDATRASLWGLINTREFPAGDLVAPLTELARTHSTRLNEIRKYIRDGAPLPQCKTIACAPVACQSTLDSGYKCDAGYYLSEKPVCVPNPNYH